MSARNVRTALSLVAMAACTALFVSAPAAYADDPMDTGSQQESTAALKVGDNAPAITIADWVKGEPITGLEKGRVYVVEFWATWCGPCRVSIPHLTEMAHKYKSQGVTFIGISSSDKSTEIVKKFVDKMGDKMDYTVAVDKKRATDKAWMEASGQGGIPTAFVVDREGKIAWIGHPMSYLESVLGQIVTGKFDAKKQMEMEAKAETTMKEFSTAAKSKDWDAALKAVDTYASLDASHAEQAASMKFSVLLKGKKDYTAAFAYGNQLVATTYKDNAQALNDVAWRILDDESLEKRDLDLALKAAQRAAELTKFEDGMILDTLARAYFEKGDKAKAVEFQTKAVEKTTDEEMKTEMQDTLEKYKK